MQFAEEVVALPRVGRVGYLPSLQSRQLVGEYHGATSVMQSIVLAGLEVRDILEYNALAEVEMAG